MGSNEVFRRTVNAHYCRVSWKQHIQFAASEGAHKAGPPKREQASEADLYMTKILEFLDWELKQYGRSATGSSESVMQKLQERMDDVGGEVETPQECHKEML